MPIPVPPEFIDFIRRGEKFIVAGHEEPDGDCVGSQLALASALRRLGKTVFPCTAGPFKRNETKSYTEYFVPCPETRERRGLSLIVTDCSARERTGNLNLEGLPTAVVDHHESKPSPGGAPWGDIAYLDPAAPSTTSMVLRIIEALDLNPTTEEAELLFLGLCTDTGFFRHAESPVSFEAAAKLTAAGASPKKAFAAINGGKSLSSRLLMGTVLAKTRSYYGGALLVSDESLADSKRYGAESRDSDMIYQLLQAVEGVQAMVLLRQETEAECTLGFRSRGRIDVAAIAALFGGGGHKNAAGAKTAGKIEALEQKAVAAFAPCFS